MDQRLYTPDGAWLRRLLILPSAALLAAGAALFGASVHSTGVANHVGYADWVPPAGGLIMALPLIAAGATSCWIIWQRTSLPYRLHVLRLLVAGGFILAAAGLGVAYIFTIDNPSSYEGDYNPFLDPSYTPNLTVETFLSASVGLSAGLLGFLYATMRYLIMTGIERPGLAAPEGLDPVGSLLTERNARRPR